jgi:RNA polymerase sigma-70 factor (ECF subfamily)
MTPTVPDDLLVAAQAGDTTALFEMLRVHRHGVYRYGLQVCRTTEDTEDAVQEALWAATRALKTFRGSASSIASWLFTIVRRECYRLLDRHRLAPEALDHHFDMRSEDLPSDEALSQRSRSELLAEALASLDPLHRDAILLRDIQEFSAPEAAARLGISVEALKSRLHRARVRLREYVLSRADHF